MLQLQQGVRLYILPLYNPELNRTEKLWRKMEYEWLAFKARDAKIIEEDVDMIIQRLGSNYRYTFY
ncbi:hypothetical protein [Burkholderia ubonensis]|uniref:hypothetical protein n=1 Tax=Burkholderia ubonensis TaxID=101571 RepID=UPI000758AC15|nr:hypothetical protein [Burkholderia ubonensis]KVQ22275.1 hypothetical protein WK00_24970 [Burkholderia ubonensis]